MTGLRGTTPYVEETLPAAAPWDELVALGFTKGDFADRDGLFRRTTLPPGWSREGSNHAMWSYIVDERGIERVSVFYKAAYYDRRARANIDAVGFKAAIAAVWSDEPPALPVKWSLFTAQERDEFRLGVNGELIDGGRKNRARDILALLPPVGAA